MYGLYSAVGWKCRRCGIKFSHSSDPSKKHVAASSLRCAWCAYAGRGAPEIDVLEYGKLGGPTAGRPTYVHTMQMGPVIPPFTSWMDASGQSGPGISLPGKSTPFETQLPNYRGQLTREGFPRTGGRTSFLLLWLGMQGWDWASLGGVCRTLSWSEADAVPPTASYWQSENNL